VLRPLSYVDCYLRRFRGKEGWRRALVSLVVGSMASTAPNNLNIFGPNAATLVVSCHLELRLLSSHNPAPDELHASRLWERPSCRSLKNSRFPGKLVGARLPDAAACYIQGFRLRVVGVDRIRGCMAWVCVPGLPCLFYHSKNRAFDGPFLSTHGRLLLVPAKNGRF
jgi:hypothetical protein